MSSGVPRKSAAGRYSANRTRNLRDRTRNLRDREGFDGCGVWSLFLVFWCPIHLLCDLADRRGKGRRPLFFTGVAGSGSRLYFWCFGARFTRFARFRSWCFKGNPMPVSTSPEQSICCARLIAVACSTCKNTDLNTRQAKEDWTDREWQSRRAAELGPCWPSCALIMVRGTLRAPWESGDTSHIFGLADSGIR